MEMRKPKRDELNQILVGYHNTINDTLQFFEQTPPLTHKKLSWNDVLEISDHLSNPIVGMLWTGEPPQAEPLKETMESYFNALHGFLLHCHGSMAAAGPTLSSSIHASVKQIFDSSFRLLQVSVSLYEGGYEKGSKPSIPQLAGAVWEACSNLKKVPATNIKAIRRVMTQVAVSMKDVLRELKELKLACSSSEHDAYANPERETPNSDEDDLGDDLSPEEFEVAEMVADIVSEALVVNKELVRAITGMIKLENPKDNGEFVDSLEKLLKLCQRNTGVQIDELGACVYPP